MNFAVFFRMINGLFVCANVLHREVDIFNHKFLPILSSGNDEIKSCTTFAMMKAIKSRLHVWKRELSKIYFAKRIYFDKACERTCTALFRFLFAVDEKKIVLSWGSCDFSQIRANQVRTYVHTLLSDNSTKWQLMSFYAYKFQRTRGSMRGCQLSLPLRSFNSLCSKHVSV